MQEFATPGSYKRTSFEPINLADADFSAAVIRTQEPRDHAPVSTGSEVSTSYVFPHIASGSNVILNSAINVSAGSNIVQNSTGPSMSGSHVIQKNLDQIYSEVTQHSPAVSDISIDNVLSSASSDSGDPQDKPRSSLPDVAATMQKTEKFDLINDRVLNAIVDSSSSDAKPIGFHAVSKPVLSESDLNKYLDQLEDDTEDNSVEEVSSLPVVSTDDEISSSQSQLEECTTGTSSSGDGKPTEVATNSEFENLLSPESSTASSNQGLHTVSHQQFENHNESELEDQMKQHQVDNSQTITSSHMESSSEPKTSTLESPTFCVENKNISELANTTVSATEDAKEQSGSNAGESDFSHTKPNVVEDNVLDEMKHGSCVKSTDVTASENSKDVTKPDSFITNPSSNILNTTEMVQTISEPSEQNETSATVNTKANEQTLDESKDIQRDSNNAGVESIKSSLMESKNESSSFESKNEMEIQSKPEVEKSVEGINAATNVIEFTNEPTEILNTNYVVEISQPGLIIDGKGSRNNSPQKSSPPVNTGEISNTDIHGDSSSVEHKPNNIQFSSNISQSERLVCPSENASKEDVETRDTRIGIENILVKNNLTESSTALPEKNINLPETKSNLPEYKNQAVQDIEVKPSECPANVNAYSDVSRDTKTSESTANTYREVSRDKEISTEADLVNKYRHNFVHNDLEITREKNTNVEKWSKPDTPCITISNMKDTGIAEVQGETERSNAIASPDCYVEEKSIADCVQQNCDSMVHSEQRPNMGASNSTTSEYPSNPQPVAPESASQTQSEITQVTPSTQKPVRPNSLDLPSSPSVSLSPSETPPNLSDSEPAASVAQGTSGEAQSTPSPQHSMLGKRAPFWVPDTEAPVCMHCQARFTLVKRRHHCRACGQVLCSRCCNRRATLEYLQYAAERVCLVCYDILMKPSQDTPPPPARKPNPNNPMEYCSTIPPLQQVAQSGSQPPPSVLVPVSVLKREGSLKSREGAKQVMFSDGIKPGGDLTELDAEREVSKLPIVRKNRMIKRVGTPPGNLFHKRPLHPDSNSFIPTTGLPPILASNGGEVSYSELTSPLSLEESVKFAIHRNLFAHVKKIKLDCCLGKKRTVWNVTSEGLNCVGQDEVVFLLACTQGEEYPPQHIFHVILYIYTEAAQGSTVTEMCFVPSPPTVQELLGSKDHGGFIFIRRTNQCLTHLTLPDPPYLFGVLVHRWEIPWAKLFPLRLVLRLGAALKCYPCPLLSIRYREPVYIDVGHTIIKLLADFRSYAYTLPTVRGLLIHMEENKTSVIIPKNFYDQVVKAINHSNESHLAFAGNFSAQADSHLVCVQNVEAETSEYSTQRIESTTHRTNTGQSCTGLAFILFNASLKTSDGMTGKACIHEDGLMVHLLPDGMVTLRAALHDMRDYTILCGPQGEESVDIVWGPQDLNFNVGVRSVIDGKPLDGVQSIRVHGGTDYTGGVKLIRWTEVFIIENSDLNAKTTEDPIDHMKKLSESISRATCISLVPLIDSLASADASKFAVRVTIHPDDVGYEAGTRGEKFDAKYMRHLDEGLVPIIHQAAVHSTSPLTLELVFRIMEQG
ncbi:uncharacterized protein LOC103524460 isoform X2 [Diaphorina citri]|uniref:Uncharacterized protein LOC103524460 isoform X2 n=1 Tax=Diaphorina citri TaxID=121845 RepID=A0A3Q0IHK6_DIACI|nr:uncharacterized protein LOC103524460 isoform X2 [Diaphorina citri]